MLSQISLDPSSKGNQYKPYILQHGLLCMYLDTSKYSNIYKPDNTTIISCVIIIA